MTRPLARALLLLLLVLTPPPADAETVHLIPEDKAPWGPGRLFSFLRPGHNFGERTIEVETTPPDATLDLYYVRAGFQKRYEQAQAPATVVLPKRVEAGSRDTVTIRAFADGFRAKEVTVRVKSGQDRVLLELDTLPNALQGLLHTYFGGRGSLTFLTKESLSVRVQEGSDFVQIALHETAKGGEVDDAAAGIRSPLLDSVTTQQVGEDLLVRLDLSDTARGAEVDLRSRQSHDPVRDLYLYSIDLVPPDGGGAIVERASRMLARIRTEDVTGCALRFDEALHEALDSAELARALTPRGAFTDPYLRAAMKRLGEVSPGGAIAMKDGSRWRASVPLELSAAMSQASEARGYLALLRRFVELLEPRDARRSTLRGLIAPELPAGRFDDVLDAAERRERNCG